MIAFSTILCVSDAQSAHNFKVVFLIHRTTLWQEFMMSAKPSHLTELKVILSVLAFLKAFIGIIGLWFQCHTHTLMIRHQL